MTNPLTHYLVVGPLCWGRAETVAGARRKARESYSKRLAGPWREVVYRVPADAWVDEMGRIRWADGSIKIEEVTA